MTTITPEERAKLRLFAEDMDVELAERCLDALEAAEARAEKAERERDVLVDFIKESSCYFCPLSPLNLDDECLNFGTSYCNLAIQQYAAQKAAKGE